MEIITDLFRSDGRGINDHPGINKISEFEYKKQHSLEKRSAESKKIKAKYPDRIPVICEVAKNSRSLDFDIDKKKYLVPTDLTVGQFVYVVRKRVKLEPEQAIYLFVNNTLPPTGALMSNMYEQHKDEDGYLYFHISKEQTFG